jgi:two-component system chemotaxis response regulator CheB
MIRVVVAEDSLTVRELLVAILAGDPQIEVVGQAKHGAEAIELVLRLRPDVVTMDIEMPGTDGLEATREIMARAPTPIVVVSASSSWPHVQRSFEAVKAGALVMIDKPSDPASPAFEAQRQQLVSMVKAMSAVKVVRRRQPTAILDRGPAPARSAAPRSFRTVVVAASTGGPAALQQLLGGLSRNFSLPLLVVQHIAGGFVEGLAEWLAATCDLDVRVARGGERPAPRTVYLAPDDRHIGFGSEGRLLLSAAPPIEGHRPAADVLFESAAELHGDATIAVVLTGMGRDGARGARRVRERGGWVLAQDAATSVVYGMNRATIECGAVDEIHAIDRLGPALAELARTGENR